MSGHESLLLRSIPYGPADTIGILNGNIEKIPFTGGLIVGNGTLDHMPQVIELVAQIFHSHPTLLPCPVMRMFRIHRTGGIQISVRFLGSGYNSENTIDVFLQPLVGDRFAANSWHPRWFCKYLYRQTRNPPPYNLRWDGQLSRSF